RDRHPREDRRAGRRPRYLGPVHLGWALSSRAAPVERAAREETRVRPAFLRPALPGALALAAIGCATPRPETPRISREPHVDRTSGDRTGTALPRYPRLSRGRPLEAERTIDVGRVPMTLLLGRS